MNEWPGSCNVQLSVHGFEWDALRLRINEQHGKELREHHRREKDERRRAIDRSKTPAPWRIMTG
jgi:hypothetical protein